MQGAFDLVVKGGVVVGPTGRGQLDVYVLEGKVVALEPFPARTLAAACSGEKRAHLRGRSYVDYGLAAHIWDDPAGHLERVVGAYARAPARRYGLAGKGRLAPGADADLVLVDPSSQSLIADEGVHSKAGWTPYAGRAVRGSVVSVLLRGVPVVDNGRVVTAPSGQFMAGPGTVEED